MNYRELKWIVLYVVAWIGLPIAAWAGYSYFEARSFTRLTGKQVTVWDAMFLDLRIQEQVGQPVADMVVTAK